MTACSTIACGPSRQGEEHGIKRISHFRPAVDVIEDTAEFRIIADVPGASPESIEIEFQEGSLVLTARVAPRRAEKLAPIINEYDVGDFRRVFKLSQAIAPDKIAAQYSEGVLTIRLPKTETARRHKIDVKVN